MEARSRVKSKELSIEDIPIRLNNLNVDSFFILEKGNCSYLQCINYNNHILIEERVYSDNGFKHFVLANNNNNNNNNNNFNNNKDIVGNNKLSIDDTNFKRFPNELFSIEEAIDIFTDYYTDIPFKNILKRNITLEFGILEKGFVFIQWLESAVDNFKENLDEFVEIIEPFVIDELKKDCIGHKIVSKNILDKIDQTNNENDGKLNPKCSIFQVIDIQWAVESIVEIALKYEFLEDILLFKKNKITDEKFFKFDLEDFKH
jgi:hypothetical protein